MDTLVTVQGDRLIIELYQKPTDKNTLLHFSSSHLRPMVRSLPFSQLLRARRITVEEKRKQKTVDKMATDFKHGYGYKEDIPLL